MPFAHGRCDTPSDTHRQADAVSGTQRPYAYFQRYFDQGASWTFVVQNRVPHCCIMNAKALILGWLDAVLGL